MNRLKIFAAALTATMVTGVALAPIANAYPIDGYEDTGIARVEGARRAHEGIAKGSKQPPGALLSTEQVDLRMLEHANMDLPARDPAFTRQITKLLGGNASRYGLAVLDLSDVANPRYAEHRGDYQQNVGSVGKIVVALGLFQALADVYPNDIAARTRVLKDTIVTADDFANWDHHKLRIFDVDTNKLKRSVMTIGLQANLWQYMDWMLSVSSNSAAAMNQREAMLIRKFGKAYPPSDAERTAYFKDTPRKELQADFVATFFEPVTRNGLSLEHLRQGSFFTRTGKKNVPGGGNSYGTARELLLFMLRMEQGRLVDRWSSLQIKRLLYMTERRIRYASAPTLKDSAVYFKSGSLYSCIKGTKCGKYKGNKKNYMNSVALIETPAGENRLFYISTLISNVLLKNSAVDHQTLATRIHRLVEKAHPAPVAPKAVAAPVAGKAPKAVPAKTP